ncbi:MAG: hypothetical protein KKH88_00735 [Nanoarchaeota archaeon]|nr:hypothetical protein [Nanoarchaeota archaeon]
MKFLKKAAAVGMSVAMLGMTAAGALAADLADYPGPFIANDAFVSTALVIGSTDDSAARSDINTYLGGQATAVSGDVTVSGGKQEEFYIGVALNDTSAFGTTGLTDTHIDTLIDSKVSWADKTYDMQEKILFGDAKIQVSGNATGQKDFGSDPYLVIGTSGVEYRYEFDGTGGFNESSGSSVNVTSATNPLSITFLGKPLEITTIDVGTTGLVINLADKYAVAEGDSLTVEGYTVTVGSIFSGSVEVSYGGDTQLISTSSTHDFGPVSVKIDQVGQNTNNPELSKAVIYVGSKITETVKDEAVFELFIDYETDGDAPWKWEINSTATSLYSIGIVNRLSIDDIDDVDAALDPVTVGGSIVFPNNFAAISFDEVTNENYVTVEISTTEDMDLNDTAAFKDKTGLVFSALEGEYLQIAGIETDTIYALEGTANDCDAAVWDLWYLNEDGIKTDDTTAGNGTFKILNEDQDMTVSWSNTTMNVTIAKDTNGFDETLSLGAFGATTCFATFGSTDAFNTGEGEIFIAGTLGELSGRDYDVRTVDGVIIVDPETNLDNDKIVLKIPNDVQKAKVTVSATVSSEGSGTEAALMTDDEVGTASDYNLILVGGPCVNSLTAQFLGLSAGSCGAASTFSADTAYLKLKDNGDKVALIVAGWEAADTKRAAKVVANPDSFTLSGESMTVTGTSLEVSGITVV